jgi:hypothetical protein
MEDRLNECVNFGCLLLLIFSFLIHLSAFVIYLSLAIFLGHDLVDFNGFVVSVVVLDCFYFHRNAF